jgi:hypothetical protein
VSGVDTTGFHRLMVKGKNRLGVSLHSRRRLYEFHRRAEERGESLPAAITLGIHPLHYMGSMVYAYPPQVRKFEIIGGLFGEPYRLARCGVADLEVPAGAEIIIEGEILANVHEPEGRSANSPGTRHTGARRTYSSRIGFACAATPCSIASSLACRAIISWFRASHAKARSSTRCGAICPMSARACPAYDVRRLHGLHLDEEDRRGRAADGHHGHPRHRAVHQVRHRCGRRRRYLQHQ